MSPTMILKKEGVVGIGYLGFKVVGFYGSYKRGGWRNHHPPLLITNIAYWLFMTSSP